MRNSWTQHVFQREESGQVQFEILTETFKWRLQEARSYKSLVLGEVGIWMVFKVRSLAKIDQSERPPLAVLLVTILRHRNTGQSMAPLAARSYCWQRDGLQLLH